MGKARATDVTIGAEKGGVLGAPGGPWHFLGVGQARDKASFYGRFISKTDTKVRTKYVFKTPSKKWKFPSIIVV